jgi:hypothetical protein
MSMSFVRRKFMGNPLQIKFSGRIGRQTYDVCSTAGINLMSSERVRFSRLAQSLQNDINMMTEANSSEVTYARALLGASMIKATCEAFIDMTGTLAGAVGLKPVEQAAKWLGTGGKAADFAIGKAYGQKTDGFGVVTSAAGSLLGTNRLTSKMSDKSLAELQLVKIEIVKGAVSGDPASVKQEVFLAYLPKISEMTLAAVNREVAGKLLSAGASLAKAGSSYSNALEKAFDEKLTSEESVRERTRWIETMRSQLVLVIAQIKVIDQILLDCRLGRGLA